MYDSSVLNIFAECSHQHYLTVNISFAPEATHPSAVTPPHSPHARSLAATNHHSVPMGLPVLDVSGHGSHTVCGFCNWLPSRSMMFSGFIRSVACISVSFLLGPNNTPACAPRIVCPHSLAGGHSGCCCWLAAANRGYTNTPGWVCVWTRVPVLLVTCLEVERVGHVVTVFN